MFLVDDSQCAIVYDHAFRSCICMAFFIFNVPLYLHQYVFIYLLCTFTFVSPCISGSISELALYLPCHVFVDLSLRYLCICVTMYILIYIEVPLYLCRHMFLCLSSRYLCICIAFLHLSLSDLCICVAVFDLSLSYLCICVTM